MRAFRGLGYTLRFFKAELRAGERRATSTSSARLCLLILGREVSCLWLVFFSSSFLREESVGFLRSFRLGLGRGFCWGLRCGFVMKEGKGFFSGFLLRNV